MQRDKTFTENDQAELCRLFNLSDGHLREMLYGKKLNVAQAAEMLGVQKSEVYSLIISGELLAFRLNKHYRIPELSIVDFISRRMLKTALD